MKAYIVLVGDVYRNFIEKIFLDKKEAERYTEDYGYKTFIQEHEVCKNESL